MFWRTQPLISEISDVFAEATIVLYGKGDYVLDMEQKSDLMMSEGKSVWILSIWLLKALKDW